MSSILDPEYVEAEGVVIAVDRLAALRAVAPSTPLEVAIDLADTAKPVMDAARLVALALQELAERADSGNVTDGVLADLGRDLAAAAATISAFASRVVLA